MTNTNSDTEKAKVEGRISGQTRLLPLSILYLAAVGAAEFVTYYVTATGGIVFHFVILLSLIVASGYDSSTARRQLWLALGLAPLIRILSLVIPQPEISEVTWYVLIGIPVAACIIAMMRNLKLDANDVGINGKAPFIQVMVAINGIGLGLVDYLMLKPDALNPELTLQATIFPALVLFVFTGLLEELAFRGVMQREADAASSWGWVFVATVYAILQIGQGSILHGMFIFLVALFFGWEVKKTGSIIGVMLAHGFLNIGLFLVFPHIF